MPVSVLNSVAPAKGSVRMSWLDFFRGMAVVVMIETHVVNTFLLNSLRAAPWFEWLNYLNGLVAPSFLFIAGYLQGLSMRRHGPRVAPRKWGRLAALLALGYLIQIPISQLIHGCDALRIGSQVNVLQCLAVSLALLLAVQRLAGAAGDGVLALALVGFVGAAEIIKSYSGAPIPLLAFINASTGSLFPLFPWAGFVIAGALATAWPETWHEFLLPLGAWVASFALPAPSTFSAQSVSFFVERLAWVFVLAWLVKRSPAQWQPKWLLLAGRESMVMYVGHLLLITALASAGVAQIGLGAALLFYLGILAIVWAVAWKREGWLRVEGFLRRGP